MFNHNVWLICMLCQQTFWDLWAKTPTHTHIYIFLNHIKLDFIIKKQTQIQWFSSSIHRINNNYEI